MTLWICATCGIEHEDTPQPPEVCAICSDERQYLPEGGQQWTTLQALQQDRHWQIEELEPDLFSVTVEPKVGIGQRGLLVRTPAGNVLWECPGYLDDGFVGEIERLGGVVAITASHPHLTGLSVSLSRAFDNVPVYWAEDDREWIRRPDDAIVLWRGERELLPGVSLIQCGGHFAGSAVLHWRDGAGGKGVVLSGDTFLVGSDRATVGFLRSYPNRIPLSARSVERIADAVAPLAYDRVYSGFAPGLIEANASEAVQYSARRHIGWVTGELHDPD
jgi:glyoxylase-like metal-dependent hydrolase (beta-lactamase superfamily II)